ncbi:MAG TPA: sugar transferase, partial [Thermodesulfatator atlanticus]|nr:sugar transferase [Thermodesulfatator atlanticus]
MKRLFFIAHRLPYPPNKGDKLRAYHILKHLKRYFAEIYLFTHLDETRDLGVVDQLDLPLA